MPGQASVRFCVSLGGREGAAGVNLEQSPREAVPTKGRLCQVRQPACAKQLAVPSRLCLAVPSTGAAWHSHPPVLFLAQPRAH